jgi:hypothetical protein
VTEPARVWLVESGYYSDRDVVGVYASESAAVDGIKAIYGAPYRVTWEPPTRDGDTLILTGHFEAVDGYSTAHVSHYEIRPVVVQGQTDAIVYSPRP